MLRDRRVMHSCRRCDAVGHARCLTDVWALTMRTTALETRVVRFATKHLVPLLMLALIASILLIGACTGRTLASIGIGRGEVVTSLPLGKPDKLEDLVDKHADLKGVSVLEVVGDKAFWIGRDAKERILVYLEEDQRPGQAVEGGIDVRAGQVVDLYAAVTRLPSPEQIRRQWDLNPAAFEAIRREKVYLYVADVRDLRIAAP